jgi:hypothetical protein
MGERVARTPRGFSASSNARDTHKAQAQMGLERDLIDFQSEFERTAPLGWAALYNTKIAEFCLARNTAIFSLFLLVFEPGIKR